jgi:DNA-binding SARP family transcriptional activator
VLALLGYPTAEGWWHLRRELAELLGPDSGEPHARADLRATVSKLRKTREPNRAVGSRVVYVRDSPIVLAEGIHSAGADQKQVTAREADKELA